MNQYELLLAKKKENLSQLIRELKNLRSNESKLENMTGLTIIYARKGALETDDFAYFGDNRDVLNSIHAAFLAMKVHLGLDMITPLSKNQIN